MLSRHIRSAYLFKASSGSLSPAHVSRTTTASAIRAKSCMIYKSNSNNPFFNIAFENFLLTKDRDDNDHILYLWRNGPSVIIGRFQSAWKECQVTRMEENNVNLVRRSSGGGAVYQDLNNSIFTFLGPRDKNDVAANNSIITKALLERSNIVATPTGRNDMEVDGYKVSGAAFRQTANRTLHHGTLLLDVDMTALDKYLTPNKLKMQSKGIASVSARVSNLKKFDETLTHDGICDAISECFQKHHGATCEVIEVDESLAKEEPSVQQMMDELMDHNWRFGKEPAFTNNLTTRFAWGMIDIYISTKKGSVIAEATVYSDALDTEFITRLQEALVNSEYSKAGMTSAIEGLSGAYPSDSPSRANADELLKWLVDSV